MKVKLSMKIVTFLRSLMHIAFVVFVMSFLPLRNVQAQSGPVIQAFPGDDPLIIQGWLDQTHNISGDLRLTANEAVEKFIFLPSDLKRQNSQQVTPDMSEVISRQHVMLTGETSLQASVPKDFQVTVSGIDVPGTYNGCMIFMIPGQEQNQWLSIPITVQANLKPTMSLMPGSDPINLKLVSCEKDSWNCKLAEKLFPKATSEERCIQVENKGDLPASLLTSYIVIQGQLTGYQVPSDVISINTKQDNSKSDNSYPDNNRQEKSKPDDCEPGITEMKAHTMNEIPIYFELDKLPPDHYTGDIYLRLGDGTDDIQVPVNLEVREGPFVPVVFIIFGILLGRLVKYMQERGDAEAKALLALSRLDGLVEDSNTDAKAHLKEMLAEQRTNIHAGMFTDVETQLKMIQARYETLKQLRKMELSLADKQKDTRVTAVIQKIEEARQHVYSKEDTDAKNCVDALKASLSELVSQMGGEQNARGVKDAMDRARKASSSMGHAVRMSKMNKPNEMNEPKGTNEMKETNKLKEFVRTFLKMIWNKLVKWFNSLRVGFWDRLQAEGILYVARPVLYVVLVIGLTIVGLNKLYVDSGTTFGAQPVDDYMALVLWGLSAEVAGRTLGDLAGKVGTTG